MATSRAISAPPLHSLPELIPSAGEWSRVNRTPASGGHFWTAESSGLTARRAKTAQLVLQKEGEGGPGRMEMNWMRKKKQLRAVYGPSKNVIEHDWHRQKRESRSRMGPRSWTGPVVEDSKMRPLTTNERVPRTLEIYKMCESTCIPGVGWGELLARDRYCERHGLTSFSVENGKVEFKPFEPAPETAKKMAGYIHPIGKDADFFDRLRNYKGSNRQVHERDWDNSAVWQPAVLHRDMKRDSFRQSMYKTGRAGRSYTSTYIPDHTKTASQFPLEGLDQRQRALAHFEEWYQPAVLVTGGSWDLSIQQAVGQAGGQPNQVLNRALTPDNIKRPWGREGPKMRALRESLEQSKREQEEVEQAKEEEENLKNLKSI